MLHPSTAANFCLFCHWKTIQFPARNVYTCTSKILSIYRGVLVHSGGLGGWLGMGDGEDGVGGGVIYSPLDPVASCVQELYRTLCNSRTCSFLPAWHVLIFSLCDYWKIGMCQNEIIAGHAKRQSSGSSWQNLAAVMSHQFASLSV